MTNSRGVSRCSPLASWTIRVGSLCVLGTASLATVVVGALVNSPARGISGPQGQSTRRVAIQVRSAHGGAPLAQHQATDERPGRKPGSEGRRAAKQLLLETLKAVDHAIRKSACCTMTFRKQERIGGKLLPEQTYFSRFATSPSPST